MQQLITVRFTHPRISSSYVADVSPQLKASHAILELLSPLTGPFLSPLPPGEEYQLVLQRTGVIIPADATMDDVGVRNNDTLHIVLDVKAG